MKNNYIFVLYKAAFKPYTNLKIIPKFKEFMANQIKYHTLNRDYFLQTAQSFRKPFTAKEIADRLKDNENPMGTSTIYRLLDEFSSDGTLHKTLGPDNTAKFFYLKQCENENHLYLECEKCHHMFHIDCRHLRGLAKHVAKKHYFDITSSNLIIPGICGNCQEKNR